MNGSSLFEAIRAFWHIKNSEFFSGHFHGKSLENQRKTIQKTHQNSAKKPRFLTRFFRKDLRAWCLKFLWSLELGICSLHVPCSGQAPSSIVKRRQAWSRGFMKKKYLYFYMTTTDTIAIRTAVRLLRPRSAGFQTCCIADFQIGWPSERRLPQESRSASGSWSQ